VIIQQRDQPRDRFFRIQRFERVDRKNTHRWIVFVENVEQGADGALVADLSEGPWHDPVDLVVLQQRDENRDRSRVAKVAQQAGRGSWPERTPALPRCLLCSSAMASGKLRKRHVIGTTCSGGTTKVAAVFCVIFRQGRTRARSFFLQQYNTRILHIT
jgi:hypothetical protein